jgi:hypothetical protein
MRGVGPSTNEYIYFALQFGQLKGVAEPISRY